MYYWDCNNSLCLAYVVFYAQNTAISFQKSDIFCARKYNHLYVNFRFSQYPNFRFTQYPIFHLHESIKYLFLFVFTSCSFNSNPDGRGAKFKTDMLKIWRDQNSQYYPILKSLNSLKYILVYLSVLQYFIVN